MPYAKTPQEIKDEEIVSLTAKREEIRRINEVKHVNDPRVIDVLVWYFMQGESIAHACAFAECSVTTFKRWLRDGRRDAENGIKSEKTIWTVKMLKAKAEGCSFIRKKAEENINPARAQYYVLRLKSLDPEEKPDPKEEQVDQNLTAVDLISRILPLFLKQPQILINIIENDSTGKLREYARTRLLESDPGHGRSGKGNGATVLEPDRL